MRTKAFVLGLTGVMALGGLFSCSGGGTAVSNPLDTREAPPSSFETPTSSYEAPPATGESPVVTSGRTVCERCSGTFTCTAVQTDGLPSEPGVTGAVRPVSLTLQSAGGSCVTRVSDTDAADQEAELCANGVPTSLGATVALDENGTFTIAFEAGTVSTCTPQR